MSYDTSLLINKSHAWSCKITTYNKTRFADPQSLGYIDIFNYLSWNDDKTK